MCSPCDFQIRPKGLEEDDDDETAEANQRPEEDGGELEIIITSKLQNFMHVVNHFVDCTVGFLGVGSGIGTLLLIS